MSITAALQEHDHGLRSRRRLLVTDMAGERARASRHVQRASGENQVGKQEEDDHGYIGRYEQRDWVGV